MSTPVRQKLAWSLSPDIYLARREAARLALLNTWMQSFQAITPTPTRLMTVMAVIRRYRQNVQKSLSAIDEDGGIVSRYRASLTTADEGALMAPPKRLWWQKKPPTTPATVKDEERLAQKIQETRAASAALERILMTWNEISVQHDEVSILMGLLDQDLGPLLSEESEHAHPEERPPYLVTEVAHEPDSRAADDRNPVVTSGTVYHWKQRQA